MTTTANPKCLSLREVAATFGVTPQTVRAWVRAGRFPRPLDIGVGKLLWSPRAVERVLAGRRPRKPAK
jgi:predicted DNA-binding transcriptional regulator AlpA